MYWMGSSFILDERAICTLWPAPLPTSLKGPLQRTIFLLFAVAHASLSYPSASAGSRHDTEKAYSLREAVCRGLVCLSCRPVMSAATPSVSVWDSVWGRGLCLVPCCVVARQTVCGLSYDGAFQRRRRRVCDSHAAVFAGADGAL